jgi:hypothetical protein
MRAIALTAVCGVAAALAACEDEPSARGAATPTVIVRCSERVEGRPGDPKLSRSRDVVTSGIAFYGLRAYARRARTRTLVGGKVLAGVWAGMHTEVSLEGRSRRLASMSYGRSFERRREVFGRSVEFRACAPDEPRFSGGGPVGPVTHFAGGFRVLRPHCLRLRIAVAGHGARHVALGYGVPPERC